MTDPVWAHPGDSCALVINPAPAGPGRVWVCDSMPPHDWPWETTTLGPDRIGPDYTVYSFSAAELAVRYAQGALFGADRLARGITYWNAPTLIPGVSRYLWQLLPDRSPPMTIDVLRGTVHAKIGTLEEACNVLHYISDPEVPITPEIVATFGDKLATQWTAFLGTAMVDPLAGTMRTMLSGQAVWDEIRAAHVQIDGGIVKWAAGTDTYFKALGGGFNSGAGAPLPPQLACCITFHTGVRAGKKGRSGRGRAYLGPLAVPCLNAGTAAFATGFPAAVAAAWKTHLVTAMDTGPDPFKAVVLSPATNARYLITDVLVGQIPDDQRRRRRSLLELPVTAP